MLIQSMPLATTAADLRSGALDLMDYVEEALKRLETVNEQVQAFLPEPGRRERLLRAAEALQAQYPAPASRPLLYGVLVGVKDIFAVDGLPTQAGSTLPPELFTQSQATCVTLLQKQGALVLGKTVTTEFAYFEPGPTRNPHNLAHTPGGSSSGSAAGVAAGLCQIAIGTQTVGSVIRPAAYCGIVGFKPSYGRIDPTGVIYVARALDHVGLFTQDVEGMAQVAAVLCRDWQPVTTVSQPVLGVPDGPYLDQATPEALATFGDQVERLQAAGYRVERVPLFADIAEIDRRHKQLMAYQMTQEHHDWFAQYADRYRPRTAQLIQTGQTVADTDAQAAIVGQAQARQALAARMAETGIDIWISPAAPGPALVGINSTGDPAMNLPWTHAGVPTITVPAGVAENGLPLGLQCASAFGADGKLLAWSVGLYTALNRDN